MLFKYLLVIAQRKRKKRSVWNTTPTCNHTSGERFHCLDLSLPAFRAVSSPVGATADCTHMSKFTRFESVVIVPPVTWAMDALLLLLWLVFVSGFYCRRIPQAQVHHLGEALAINLPISVLIFFAAAHSL